MCIKILTVVFIIFAAALSVQLATLIIGLNKKLKPMAASDYLSSITATMFLYVLCALFLVFFVPGFYSKLLMLFFGIAPFIIGKITSYKNLKLYTILQLLCVIISIVYVLVL